MALETRTIPRLVRATVEATPDRTWLVTPEGELTYAQAQDRIERAATGLRSTGVARGDRVLVTPRNRRDHLLAWLALMEVGATQVPVNPKSTAAELAGFVDQVEPALVVTDPDFAPLLGDTPVPVVHAGDLYGTEADGRGPADVDEDAVAVMIPTSGTTGLSKLVMPTHRAYVMAGEGFPWWLELTADDRLMTTLPLPHQRPGVLDVGFDRRRGGPGPAARLLRERLPGRRPPVRGDPVQLHRGDAGDPAPPAHRPSATPLRLCYTGPSPTEERQLEAEARFGLRITCGYALSETPYGTVWRHGTRPYGTLGAVRQHPTLGHVNDGRVMAKGAESKSAGRASWSCATRRSSRATTRCRRRRRPWSSTGG